MTRSNGFTMLELVIVMVIINALTGIAIAGLKDYNRPSQNAADLTRAIFKQARAKAIANTAAYKIAASGATLITASYADKCSSVTFINDPLLELEMPEGALLETTGWSVCFNSRGLADTNLTISLRGSDGESKSIEVLLGGATREL